MGDISIERLNQLHPAIRQSAIDAYLEAVAATPKGIHPIITQTLRTFEEQAEIYAQGRTKPGSIVTKSKPGQSYHNYGLALDFALQVNGKLQWEVNSDWMIVVSKFKDHGFDWGGDWPKFKDSPHFENRLGKNWRELLVMYNDKKFIPGTIYLDIS